MSVSLPYLTTNVEVSAEPTGHPHSANPRAMISVGFPCGGALETLPAYLFGSWLPSVQELLLFADFADMFVPDNLTASDAILCGEVPVQFPNNCAKHGQEVAYQLVRLYVVELCDLKLDAGWRSFFAW